MSKLTWGKNIQSPCNRHFITVVKEIKGDLNKCKDMVSLTI